MSMMKKIQELLSIPPVVIDGTLYVLIAMFGAIEAVFSEDTTYKYVNAFIIFWVKAVCVIFLSGVTALKMFRSTSYGDHLAKKANDNSTTQTQTVVQSVTTETKPPIT